jgi:hypothetical protein
MKNWILSVITLFLLQATALAAASSSFEGNFEGVLDDNGGIKKYLAFNLPIYGIMLTSQLLPQQRDPLVFDQQLMWTNYLKCHTKRNGTFTCCLWMELLGFV